MHAPPPHDAAYALQAPAHLDAFWMPFTANRPI